MTAAHTSVRVTTYESRPHLVYVGIGGRDPDRATRATAVLDADQAQRLIEALAQATALAREAAVE